ncbi:MAG: GMC oxidoreductase [Ilumatobacteraceae bacterium]
MRNRADLATLSDRFSATAASVMTVHLCSTVPMGDDPEVAAADSHGRVFGTDNVHVNGASLLPDAPGVNPQASVMAVALRNAGDSWRPDDDDPRRPTPDTTVVTGAAGWLGTALVHHLVGAGRCDRALVTDPSKPTAFGPSTNASPRSSATSAIVLRSMRSSTTTTASPTCCTLPA